ncbi:hypothetical protein [Nocardia sp. NPDC004722]
MVMFALSSGTASADGPSYFDPAHVDQGPGCAGTMTAEVDASQGQQGGDFASFIDSSTRVTASFKVDAAANPFGSAAPNGSNCRIPVTVTITNLDSGASNTETKNTEYDGHYGWNAAFFTLSGSGRVAVTVSTNPSPDQIVVNVPAPR